MDTQVRVMAYGVGPILDLVGFDSASGEPSIVEVKCGEHANDTTSAGPMLSPFHSLPCCGRTKTLLQLAVQFVCLRHQLDMRQLAAGTRENKRKVNLRPKNAHALIYSVSNGNQQTPIPEFSIHMRSLPEKLVSLAEIALTNN